MYLSYYILRRLSNKSYIKGLHYSLQCNLNSINLPIRLLHQLHQPPKWTTRHFCRGTAPVQVVKGTTFGGDFCVIWPSCHDIYLCLGRLCWAVPVPSSSGKMKVHRGYLLPNMSYSWWWLSLGEGAPQCMHGNMVDTILPILWRAARC